MTVTNYSAPSYAQAAADAGEWAAELFEPALATVRAAQYAGTPVAREAAAGAEAALFLLTYEDGFRAALLHGAGAGYYSRVILI